MPGNNNSFIVIILCLQTVYNCIVSITGQYIYGFFLRTYPDNFPSNKSNGSLWLNEEASCTENTSNNSAQIWAQQNSADLIFKATLWRAFPVIVTTYLFGLYASYLNRRLILFISLVGNAVHVIIYQAIIYRNLAIYWWYIAAFIAGLAGGTNVLGIVINLIITESTEENERSSYFVRIGGLSTALSAIVTLAIGYYIQWRGFTDLFWIAIGLEFLSILAVLFLLKPSNPSPVIDETTSLLSTASSNSPNVEIKKPFISSCSYCFDICAIFSFKHRSRKKSISLLLILISYVFYLLAISSTAPMLWYLLGAPFCWSSKELGNFSAISLITTAIFSVLGMKVLSYWGTNDAIICAIGHMCLLGYSLWIALAKYSWQLFLALTINPFSVYQSALTVSMISKWLEVHERSNVFTLVTEINTIILAFGSSLFNWVYAQTVTRQKNFTLLFASGLCLVPIILNLCLFIITRRVSTIQELTQTDPEPPILSLTNNLPPQATDVACLVVPSRSRANSLCTSQHGRSRAESHSSTDDQSDRQIIM